MKKYLLFLLITAVLLPTIASAESNLSDINEHWARGYVESLVNEGIINGFPDGSFKPDENILRDAFIKMVIEALGYDLEHGKDYWAEKYINKAVELNLITLDEFDSFTEPIKREEMASIINNALDEELSGADNLQQAINEIDDYNSISNNYKLGVLGAYTKGIITGYPDGNFKPKSNASRAEAAVVMLRLLDPEIRQSIGEHEDNNENNDNNDNNNNDDTVKLEDLLHKEHMNDDGVDMYWKYFLENAKDMETGYLKEDHEDYLNHTDGLSSFRIKEGTDYILKFNAKKWNATEPNFLELKEGNIPQFNKRVNNLMSYFVEKAVQMDRYIHIRGYSEDQENIDHLRIAFHRSFVGANNANYIAYYFLPQTRNLSNSEYEANHNLSKNTFIYVSVHNLMPDEYDKRYYQDEYKELLKESLIVCFGEEDGIELFELMFREHLDWRGDRGTYSGYGKTYYVAGYRIDVPKNPKNYLDFYLSLE